MDALVNSLMEELNCETVFTIPIFGGIPIYESVVVTWIIMAVVIVLCILLTRNLSVEHPGRRQIILETAVNGLNNFFRDTMSSTLLVAIGAGIAVLTGIGAGLGIGKATSSAVDAIARQPEAESKISKSLLLGCALAEATAIYGFVIALLIILFLK